ncbi:repulsive guidance molecule A-like [Pollicipes pollicipes]|uniref:repulsive guidance molecule A-like n=1 Tax=Pollicipes pollicipes TaxID=41117 RepID=UPI001884DCF4|nr:repulsive guidance molecule A-like [Pollicipes pollicipes]
MWRRLGRGWRAGVGRRAAMQFLSPFDPGIRVLTALLLSLLLCLTSAAANRCHSERCSREFERTRQTLGMAEMESASPGYCRALRRFTVCLRATERACRGDLTYHSNLRILERKIQRLNCQRVIAEAGEAPPAPRPRPRPPPTRRPTLQESVCAYHGDPEPAFCGLFGDPHVRTFSGEYQTCRVQGAWPLIDNPYLAVQVTNEPAASDHRATAPSKLTVIVKRNDPCTAQLTYEARGDLLPAAFVDGALSSGRRSGHSVTVSAVVPGQHVRITLRHINATLVIRRVAGHLTFAARLPRGLTEQSAERAGLELCSRGCPAGERIDYRHVLSAGRPVSTVHRGRAAVLTRDVIADMCREYRVTDFYFDACVFDVLFTGKTAFMEAAREAQQDLRRLMPQAVTELANRTRLQLVAAPDAAPHAVLPPLRTLLLLALALVLR